ncbi:MAG TPA: BlaI/MecI/CopY family transcriptional regulator [Longimicrobium sp.]|jgi:predicted transcriptional regulator
MGRTYELSEFQLAILRILWDRGEASAAEVHQALRGSRGLALTTISTTLQRLEKRRYVTHRAEGRGFVYAPAVSEPDVRDSMLSSMVRGLFRGDATAVVSQLLSARDVGERDIEKIRALLDEARGGADSDER